MICVRILCKCFIFIFCNSPSLELPWLQETHKRQGANYQGLCEGVCGPYLTNTSKQLDHTNKNDREDLRTSAAKGNEHEHKAPRRAGAGLESHGAGMESRGAGLENRRFAQCALRPLRFCVASYHLSTSTPYTFSWGGLC